MDGCQQVLETWEIQEGQFAQELSELKRRRTNEPSLPITKVNDRCCAVVAGSASEDIVDRVTRTSKRWENV
jgi:hypothetical protein